MPFEYLDQPAVKQKQGSRFEYLEPVSSRFEYIGDEEENQASQPAASKFEYLAGMATKALDKVPKPPLIVDPRDLFGQDSPLFTPAKMIQQVEESGPRLKEAAQKKIGDLVSAPPPADLSPGQQDLLQFAKAVAGGAAGTALELQPVTPSEALRDLLIGKGMPVAKDAVRAGSAANEAFAKYFPKAADVLFKERPAITPEMHSKINLILSDFKQKIGIPQERGLSVVDVAKAMEEGRITQAQAARYDKSLFDEMLGQRNKGMDVEATRTTPEPPPLRSISEVSRPLPEGRQLPIDSRAGGPVPIQGADFSMKPAATTAEIEKAKLFNEIRTGLGQAFEENIAKLLPVEDADNLLRKEFEELLPEFIPKKTIKKAIAEGKLLTDFVNERDFSNMTAKLSEKFGAAVSGKAGVEGFNSPDFLATAQRIPVEPIIGQAPKKLTDIIFDVSKAVGRKVSFGQPSRKAGGTYYPGTSATVVRYSGDLDTTAHELAHSLDDKFGIVAEWNKPGLISPFDAELAKFWPHGSATETGPHSSLQYKRAEGVAEWIRAWIVNPKAAASAAPNFARYMVDALPTDTIKALRSFSNDVRGFAGATAHEQIMSNVRWEPPKGSVVDFFAGNNIKEPGFHLTYADRIQTQVQDSLKAFTKAVEYARGEKGVTEVLPADDPIVLARLFSGVHSKMDDIFEKGMVDAKNNRVTKGGLSYLFEPLDRTDTKTLQREMQEVSSYMIAMRTLEKSKQLGKIRVSGIGGGLFTDAQVAEKRIAELKSNPGKFKRIEEAAGRYREWADSTLKYLVEKGRLSDKQYQAIKANNEFYVAMQRVMETAPGEEIVVFKGSGGKLGSVAQPVKSFTGSTRAIENPYTSLMQNTYKAVQEADRNDVLRVFRDLLTSDRGMQEGRVMDLASVGRLAAPTDKNTISIFVDGKKETWQFHEDVYKSLKGLIDGQSVLPGFLTALPKILRATITNFPAFAARNFIRDMQQRAILSEVKSGVFDSLKKRGPMEISDLKLFGGDQAGHYLRDRVDYTRAMQAALKDMVKEPGNIILDPKRMWKSYSDFMQGSEMRGRLAEFSAAVKHAKNVLKMDDYNANLYAASKARGLQDFAIAGNLVRTINQMVPFTNAAIQGLARTAEGAARNPKGFAARWGLVVLIPTLMERTYNQMNAKEEYDQMPAYMRDMFYNFKIAPNTWLRIPKPFELGVMASGVSRALDKAEGKKNSFDGYANSAARSLLPIDESALAMGFPGFVQAMANYDFFRNRAIVPRHEEKLDLDLRDTSNASRLAKTLQRGIGVDARKIDFLMREMFGYAGAFATDASDVGRKDRRGLGLNQTGLIVGSPAYAARDVQWVMNTAAARGLEQRKDVKALQAYLKAYWNAPNNEGKDIAAKRLTDYATNIRETWEKNPKFLENEKKKAKIKQRQIARAGQ